MLRMFLFGKEPDERTPLTRLTLSDLLISAVCVR